MEEKDIALVKNMISGDESAFDALYHSYSGKLYRMAYFITGNHSDSEDILQETFIQCFLHKANLKQPECFESWLYRILIRTAYRSEKNKKGKRELSFDGFLEEESGSMAQQIQKDPREEPLERFLKKETAAELWNAVNRLDQKHRTVVLLYYYNGLSTREIARMTGTLEGTVKSRLYKSRNLLQKSFRTSVGNLPVKEGRLYHE